jgi:hypothetical protein
MRSDCADWCNIRNAGIGVMPTTDTNSEGLVDAFFWLKSEMLLLWMLLVVLILWWLWLTAGGVHTDHTPLKNTRDTPLPPFFYI